MGEWTAQPAVAGLTRLAARRLHEIAVGQLPDSVLAKVATCLLDFFGASIGGLSYSWAPSILKYVESRQGACEAFQWGSPTLVPAEVAAFGNAALGHSLICDDMHVRSGSHIGVLVIPAALALAQRDGWSGRALVRALAGGYEMATRLGVAVRVNGRTEHFRPSGINGAFGAASAAITAVDLDEETAVSALGFAANAAAGFNEWPWAGGQEIYTHAGTAARGGIVAFDLARAGMRASASILEGRSGLFNAYAAGPAGIDAFVKSLDGDFGILETRHKPFAGCNLIQSSLSAALRLQPEIADRMNQISSVVIKTFAQAQSYPGCDNTGPFQEVQQSKMSLQYGVASALLYGRVDEETYVKLDDPRLRQLIAATRIEIVPEYAVSLVKLMQPAGIEVHTRSGEVHGAFVEDVSWLSDADVESRFRSRATAVFSPQSIAEIVEITNNLWESDTCLPLFAAFSRAKLSDRFG